MEDQLGVLGLVVNTVAVWNNRYMSASLDWIREIGEDVKEEDVKEDVVVRISPMRHGHIW